MARTVLLLFMFSFPFVTSGQKLTYHGFPSPVWPVLYNVSYEPPRVSDSFSKPVFTREIKSLAGKRIVLPGYMVPPENGLKSQAFMLSSLPLNACFFCGVGGPETVVQVYARTLVNYTDKPVEIAGILKLNDSDPDKMIYILDNAEYLGELEF